MKRGDIAVPFEIGSIERRDALDGVDAHHRHESGVIDLDALDAVVFTICFQTE